MKDKLKVILLGDMMTGKTRFINKVKNSGEKSYYNNLYCPTLGVEFGLYRLSKTKIYFWEICGDKRFESITDSYIKDVRLFLLFCDINNFSTIKNLNYWLDKIKQNINHRDKYFLNIICSNFNDKQNQTKEILLNQLHAKKYLDNLLYQFNENTFENGKIHFISKNSNLIKLFDGIYKSYNKFNNRYPIQIIENKNKSIEKPISTFSRFCQCLSNIFKNKKSNKIEPLLN